MALVAPRALITVNAMHDKDSDPRSTQITYQATRKVFSWLGAEDKLGIYYRQTGGHKQGPEDWGALLDFADLIFFGKKPENGCKFDVLPFPDEKLRFSWKAPKKDK
jgi:endo-1,4-beta-xylanase